MRASGKQLSAQDVALVGVLSAVTLVFLFAASLIPSGWTGVTAVAGLVVAVAVSATGYLSGVLCYLVSGLLALLLVPGKHVAVLFLGLFGLYPIVKSLLERLKSRVLEYLLKLAFFNFVYFLFYRLAYSLLFASTAEDWQYDLPLLPVLFVGGNLIFLLYDFAFSKVMALLQARLIPRLRKRSGGR